MLIFINIIATTQTTTSTVTTAIGIAINLFLKRNLPHWYVEISPSNINLSYLPKPVFSDLFLQIFLLMI